MGFKFWYEGVIFIALFAGLIGGPCYALTVIGSKMFNELGNFPSKFAQIQLKSFWKILVVEIVALAGLAVLFQVFYSG